MCVTVTLQLHCQRKFISVTAAQSRCGLPAKTVWHLGTRVHMLVAFLQFTPAAWYFLANICRCQLKNQVLCLSAPSIKHKSRLLHFRPLPKKVCTCMQNTARAHSHCCTYSLAKCGTHGRARCVSLGFATSIDSSFMHFTWVSSVLNDAHRLHFVHLTVYKQHICAHIWMYCVSVFFEAYVWAQQHFILHAYKIL